MFLNKIRTAARVLKRNGFYGVWEVARRRFHSLFSKLRHTVNAVLLKGFASKPRKKSQKPRILYIANRNETEYGQTIRYRIHNLRECLKGKAVTRFEVLEDGIDKDDYSISRFDIVVLMRLEMSSRAETILKKAKKYNAVTVFDIDDLIFLPEYLNLFCSVVSADEKLRELYKISFEKFNKTFQSCDFATASTPFIAEKMRENGKNAFVIHNGYNKRQRKLADQYRIEEKHEKIIGYLSGSKTHEKDFEKAFPAIIKIMENHPDVALKVTGYLNLEKVPEKLEDRISVSPFIRWDKLIAHSAGNYINIAPLDTDNPFCHAKSELKFYEAAILSVPTVASPTDTFAKCIKNKENGMLALTGDEWYNSINELLTDVNLYKKIKGQARSTAEKNYSPEAVSNEALNIYKQIMIQANC